MDNNGHYAAARQKSKVVPPPESNKINAEKVAKQIGRQSTITSGRADIVFVLDSTGSMSDEIANVKNNLGVFAQELLTTYNVQANFALVEWSDNIAISDKEPKVYLPIYEQRFSEEELRKMRFWHALPENWQEMKYKDFLLERRRLIAEVVKSAYQKL